MTYNYRETLITSFKRDERGRTSHTMPEAVCIVIVVVVDVIFFLQESQKPTDARIFKGIKKSRQDLSQHTRLFARPYPDKSLLPF